MTAFVVAPKAAPVKAVPNLLVVPVDFVTTGFAVGVTDVLVAGVVGVLDIAGFVAAVVFDVSAGFVAIAGLAAVLVAVVLEARGDLAAAVLDAIEGFGAVAVGFIPIGFDVTPARGPPRLVRGANASEVVDVMGRDVTPPRDGNLPPPTDDCPPKLSLAKEEPSPRTTEVTGRPVDKSPRSRTPIARELLIKMRRCGADLKGATSSLVFMVESLAVVFIELFVSDPPPIRKSPFFFLLL
jgi:hypothetical protein